MSAAPGTGSPVSRKLNGVATSLGVFDTNGTGDSSVGSP